jgi:adenosylmethionine---8-amino-7-oxononanoate aminotransferase
VAAASLKLLEERDWRSEVAAIEKGLTEGLAPARGLPGVADVRVLGAIGVIELTEPVDIAATQDVVIDHGVWLRPFRNLIYTMPPYVTDPSDLALITSAMVAAAG